MQFNVSFPIEIEGALRRRAAAVGKDVETFVREIVTGEVADESSPSQRPRSHDTFRGELRAIIERHGIRNGKFDDSRESMK